MVYCYHYGEHEILANTTPFHCLLPLDSHPIIRRHLVLPHFRHLLIRNRRPNSPPPPQTLPSPPFASVRTHPRPPQPHHVVSLRRDIHRHALLRRSRSPRHAVAVAAQQNHLFRVAPLFSSRYSSVRSCLLLVLRLLSLTLSPPAAHLLRGFA